MTASVGSLIVGSGTLSTRTSRLPWNVRAFISNQPPCGIALVPPVTSAAEEANGGPRGTCPIDVGAQEHPPGAGWNARERALCPLRAHAPVQGTIRLSRPSGG